MTFTISLEDKFHVRMGRIYRMDADYIPSFLRSVSSVCSALFSSSSILLFLEYLSYRLFSPRTRLVVFAYCCLHIHSRSTSSCNYWRYMCATLLHSPARSCVREFNRERIYEKVECNCLAEKPKAAIARMRYVQ